nr:VPLPA-CTERM sorting domain-containing protein [uncultured Roseovarius sp.]
MHFLRVMGAAAVLASLAATAEAATCPPSATASSATFELSDATDAACFTGNDTNQINPNGKKSAPMVLFGHSDWVLADKTDETVVGSPITFTTNPTNGAKSGRWEVADWAGRTTGDVVITLKAGNGFGAFLVDTDYFSGTWLATKGLSHASIYYRGVTPVPLPAGGFLLLSALAGLGFTRYRRT